MTAQPYDITFAGHMCFDEIVPYNGTVTVAAGSAVLCGVMAAARVGAAVAAVVKMDPLDAPVVQPMRDAGADVHVVPAAETSRMRVVHPSPNVDEREMTLLSNAGFLQPDDFPHLATCRLHLAGISDREFTIELIEQLKQAGHTLSVDMQAFVRQVDPRTRAVHFRDVTHKQRIAELCDSLKLDIVEAELLTGEADLETAAKVIERWGCREILITESEGVLARIDGHTLYEPFCNASLAGRTGRGDTTFAGYLAWSLNHPPREALRFAAALVSIKMESPGPFGGTCDEVLERMRRRHPAHG